MAFSSQRFYAEYDETWKRIKDSIYYVSNYGRVRHFLKPNKHTWAWIYKQNGQYVVKLENGKMRRLDHLVAETFLPKPSINMKLEHLNEDIYDCSARNLTWKTRFFSNQKPIICKELGIVFTSLSEAANTLNIVDNSISRALNHRQGSLTAGGYHFEYVTQGGAQ